jgi:hypothetical protein
MPGFITCPKFRTNWDLYSLQELKVTYDKVMRLLWEGPHGEYLAMQAIFGLEVANHAASRGDVIAPGMMSQAIMGIVKRDHNDSEEYIDIDGGDNSD